MKSSKGLCATAGALVLSSTLAYAQTTGGEPARTSASEETSVEMVVVTGLRNTLRGAIETKEAAEGITEVLNAEDIGKLPERNIADALQRLPGVTGNNDQGRSNTISLRGLGGAYTLVTVDGRQVSSAFGLRSVDLDIYPAEAIGRGVASKTASADQIEGGIAGTVDLSTFRPLDLGNYAAVNAESIFNAEATDYKGENGFGHRASGVISRVFLGGELAALIGVSTLRETIAVEDFNAGSWSVADFNHDGTGGDYGYGVSGPGGQVIPAPLFISEKAFIDQDRRDAATLAVQWQPGETLLVRLDGLASTYRTDGLEPWFSLNLLCDPALTGTAGAGGGVATVHSNLACATIYSGAQHEHDTTYNFGLNVDWKVRGFDVVADVAYSRAPRRYDFPFSQATGYYPAEVDLNFDNGKTIPDITLANGLNLSDPAGQYVNMLEVVANETDLDQLSSLRLDAAHDLGAGWLRKVQFGARYADRQKDVSVNNQSFVPPAAGVPVASLSHEFPFKGLYSGYGASVPTQWLYFNVYDAIAAYGPQPANVQDLSDLAQSFDIDEKTYAGYARVDFGGTVAGIPVSGNAGVRVIGTDLRSTGARADFTYSVDPVTNQLSITNLDSATLVPVVAHNRYTNVLPSFNATATLRKDLLLRLGASFSIIRPDFLDLRASSTLNAGPVFPGTPVGASGNPALHPIKAKNVDLSLEWYASKGTYLAMAPFYKKLDSFYQLGEVALGLQGQQVTFTAPEQSKAAGGALYGVELSGSYELNVLPGFLRYFTVTANLVDMHIGVHQDYNPSALQSPFLPLGMVEKSYGAGLYYDDGRLSGGLYYYGQGEMAQRDGTDYFLRRPFATLSASVSYLLGAHFMLTFSGNNLTDATQDYGDLGTDLAGVHSGYLNRTRAVGRSFFGGFRYQL